MCIMLELLKFRQSGEQTAPRGGALFIKEIKERSDYDFLTEHSTYMIYMINEYTKIQYPVIETQTLVGRCLGVLSARCSIIIFAHAH